MTTATTGKAPAPFRIIEPMRPSLPLVFASPHSGRFYPEEFRRASRLDERALRRSEDAYVDELIGAAPDAGAPVILAEYARAYLDLNREAFELDPIMFDGPLPDHVNSASERVAAGLGTIPRVVASGMAIYRRPLPFGEAERRIARIYTPYHQALTGLMVETTRRFGWAALIDCHSMPSAVARDRSRRGRMLGGRLSRGDVVDVVIGDRFGRSCAGRLTDFIESALQEMGYRTARNHPYAGGYCAQHYGRPCDGWHAVQLEINRAVYMDEISLQKTAGFAKLKKDLGQLINSLDLVDLGTPTSLAAE